ncbi:hypothetical protein J3998_02090 [Thiomicrorhabdus sp. 6S2-11]|uniref:Uncharacterized protein n=1 Tax=Thiomicrorhabdus marina TaxID=2818442 RepID=A0ABS3Q212_9GAMM|nr:hypothetical protein [Thiomicrorhabdus marina]MBO1926354.1 hypothetical protein [Thiomicrorhabdus marina]
MFQTEWLGRLLVQRLVKWLFAFLVIGCLIASARYFVSSAMLSSATSKVDVWSANNLPSEQQIIRTKQLLNTSLLWVDNAKAYYYLSKVFQWQAYQLQQSDAVEKEVASLLRLANKYAVKAVSVQPANPYYQLQVLETKIRLNEFDKQFAEIFSGLQLVLGQNSKVHWLTTMSMLPAWNKITSKQKAQVLFSIKWQLDTKSYYRFDLSKRLITSLAKNDFCHYMNIVQLNEQSTVKKICAK